MCCGPFYRRETGSGAQPGSLRGLALTCLGSGVHRSSRTLPRVEDALCHLLDRVLAKVWGLLAMEGVWPHQVPSCTETWV